VTSYHATPALSTLSLHDALPILSPTELPGSLAGTVRARSLRRDSTAQWSSHIAPMPPVNQNAPRHPHAAAMGVITRGVIIAPNRSEEHTSELQSPYDLVCRLLLE